ncbi:MAG: RcpC/CpaB family pilus assembly protein [Elusimicrobiota bacterium]
MKKIKLFLLTAVLAGCAAGAAAAELQIAPGYRAVVVPVPKAELLFIKPGDRVDMLVTVPRPGGEVTATLLQNIVVLETVDTGGIHALALLVNINEAQYAMLALSGGYQIHFGIRGKGDTELHPMEVASFRHLLGSGDEKPAEKDKSPEPAKAP